MHNEAGWCREVDPPRDEDGSSTSSEVDRTSSFLPMSQRLVLSKDVKWPGNGVRLRVAFIDKPTPPLKLQKRVVSHMNAWSKFCNARFTLINDPIAAEVRVSFTGEVLGKPNDGYWSYVGTGVLNITDRREPTMMLTGFTMDTSEAMFTRKVRHETGHTLGFKHEHLRPELVRRINREKAIKAYSYWDEPKVIRNVLTPLWKGDNSSHFFASEVADVHSIMCYPIDNSLLEPNMKEPPIRGGLDFSEYDRKHAATVYPIPEYEGWVVSEDKETIGIAASGKALYLLLISGEIRAIFDVDGDLEEHTIGEVDDPINTKLFASGDWLYRTEEDGWIKRWNGTFGSDTKEWSPIEKNPLKEQIATCGNEIYYRVKHGMVTTYRPKNEKKEPSNRVVLHAWDWTDLYKAKDYDTAWICATKTHLYRQNKKGEIYQLPLPRGDPKTGWKRIDMFTDTMQLDATWRNVYQHRENGEIWVYSGVDRHWTRMHRSSKPCLIEAYEDRLFRVEVHDEDEGTDVWYNDDNTEEGWKKLEIEENWSFFIYTGGYVYEFVRETGEVTRYTGIC
ncbi:hypothetical protein V5O48_015345 [Marasmius crinis-equi]|uniref:Peptidase metallopeptidase domain-containing protein n=1 Tax=Marasmius crinis-equi TaxID=585013 RepID=A0ABR3EUS0_9AGAR